MEFYIDNTNKNNETFVFYYNKTNIRINRCTKMNKTNLIMYAN